MNLPESPPGLERNNTKRLMFLVLLACSVGSLPPAVDPASGKLLFIDGAILSMIDGPAHKLSPSPKLELKSFVCS